MNPQQKYSWKPYNPKSPELYAQERSNLVKIFDDFNLAIEHFGSSSIPGVGGKGIIDIYIVTEERDVLKVKELLIQNGYDFKPNSGTEIRFFFEKDIGEQRYHIHLTNKYNPEIIKDLKFRDYLREHPEDAQKYSEIKKLAAEEALKKTTKEEMKKIYMDVKKPIITEILNKIV